MTVYEADLPGVGKKHEIEIGDGTRLVVVTHNTGKREVYRREDPDTDAKSAGLSRRRGYDRRSASRLSLSSAATR